MDFQKWNKQFIGGVWREGSNNKILENRNPFTDEVLVELKLANTQDVDEAYESANEAQKQWVKVPASKKVEIIESAITAIERRQSELVEILIAEAGSTQMKAKLEFLGLAVAIMKEAATYPYRMVEETVPSIIPGKENRLIHLPLGVVGVIAPWNVPFHLAMRSVISALATGSGVVLKPASFTFISGGLVMAEIFEEAGLPSGLFNVVIGAGSDIGDYFVEHPIPRMISFTGSTEVGQRIGSLASKHLKKTALELGGNNAFIVLDDADLEQAASAAVFGKFMNQGQICMAINRFVVDRKVYQPFIEKFKGKVQMLKSGDPTDPTTDIGPLIERKQVDQIKSLIDMSIKEGASFALEGRIEGNLMSPYILMDVNNEMEIAQTEIFGPVAIIIPVENEEEAIAVANHSLFGLSGSVFSKSVERGVSVANQIHTGMIHVNDQSINDEPHIAFGGEKASGIGRFNGKWALDEFTTIKWVSVQHSPREFPF
ncbi:aldehyde dehydrogenase family protein [Bacillus sp. JJ1521]|uniref:aldehyde dehydrogenase family protein n=1 Tax=Bacillus sp. JJ1521 TaxID=3122957 RepID=UPI002FFE76BB